jgi:hypothetical protein
MRQLLNDFPRGIVLQDMGKFLLWCILLLLCWPLALLALVVISPRLDPPDSVPHRRHRR